MKKLVTATGVLFFLPFLAFAQTTGYVGYIGSLIAQVGSILNLLVPILIAAAVVVFFIGLIQWIAGGEKAKANGKQVMIAGIISLFIMVSLWGIIAVMQNLTQSGTNAQHPQSAPIVPQS